MYNSINLVFGARDGDRTCHLLLVRHANYKLLSLLYDPFHLVKF